VSFNFSNESVITTLIPSYVDDSFGWFLMRRLVLLNGSIAFILNYIGACKFHISILGELGIKESWTNSSLLDLYLALSIPSERVRRARYCLGKVTVN
jgi:hypothetical protein